MSNLKSTEVEEIMNYIAKRTINGAGYVWDFSNASFKDFIFNSAGCNIDDEKYKNDEIGNSKAKRLKRFLVNEENDKVVLLLESLIDYGEMKKYLTKANVTTIKKMIKRLKKYNNIISEITINTVKNKQEEQILLKEINEKISTGQYEFVIDRLHTLLKFKFEAIFEELNVELKGKTLDSMAGELNNILRQNKIFKESTTFEILSATKKIMSSFDDARNNKTYAHTNTIMKRNEAEFLCTYMVYYYNFINKIEYKKIKIIL